MSFFLYLANKIGLVVMTYVILGLAFIFIVFWFKNKFNFKYSMPIFFCWVALGFTTKMTENERIITTIPSSHPDKEKALIAIAKHDGGSYSEMVDRWRYTIKIEHLVLLNDVKHLVEDESLRREIEINIGYERFPLEDYRKFMREIFARQKGI